MGVRFLVCIIDISSKYAWVVSLEGITITGAFQKVFDRTRLKLNKKLVDQSSDFYNRSVRSWLHSNGIEIYLTHHKEKSVVVEIFCRTLKAKIWKYMIAVSKNVYIDKLDDKYSNTYHRKTKLRCQHGLQCWEESEGSWVKS